MIYVNNYGTEFVCIEVMECITVSSTLFVTHNFKFPSSFLDISCLLKSVYNGLNMELIHKFHQTRVIS